MPTVNVGPGSNQELQTIADALGKSKRVIVVTGAGISTNCGIPDFRSEKGLYTLIQAHYDKSLANPPWEKTDSFDIDNRAKKRKRPSYFYEVIAPDGNVVGVVDDKLTSPSEVTPEKEDSKSILLPSSSPLSTRSTTPSLNRSDADLVSNGRSSRSQSFGESATSQWESNPTQRRKSSSLEGSLNPEVNSQPQLAEVCTPSDLTTQTRRSTRISKFYPESTPPIAASSLKSIATAIPLFMNSEQGSRASSPVNLSVTTSAPTVTETEAISHKRKPLPGTRRHTLQTEESIFMSAISDEDDPGTQSSQSSRTSLPNIKGRDLFDSMIWSDPFRTSIFYMFISSLRQKIQNEVTTTTDTHEFIKILRDGGRLVRNYTQNIDCLEKRLGLCTELTLGAGNRSRFNTKIQKQPRPGHIDEHSPQFGGVECVLLHGGLERLRCGICGKISNWEDDEREKATLAGQAPDCPHCEEYNARRTVNGRRELAVGRLRPNIVLYGEEHPQANLVGPLITHDLSLSPDVLLIMGTSLRVHGLKVMVKEFAKAVHSRGGHVVFVNRTKPSESTWGEVIDYWIEWDCDAWVRDLKRRREDIWLPQGTVAEVPLKQLVEGKRREPERKSHESITQTRLPGRGKRPACLRDDKQNGVFLTFKILDTLRGLVDSNGDIAARYPYFDKFGPRYSLSKVVAKVSAPSKRTKSLPALSQLPSLLPQCLPVPRTVMKRKSNAVKRQVAKDRVARKARADADTLAKESQIGWDVLRQKSGATLPAFVPTEVAKPRFNNYDSGSLVSNPSSNKSATIRLNSNPFAFRGKSNYMPGMNLVTHPPFISEQMHRHVQKAMFLPSKLRKPSDVNRRIPNEAPRREAPLIHASKPAPPPIEAPEPLEQDIKHSYGTRSRMSPTSDRVADTTLKNPSYELNFDQTPRNQAYEDTLRYLQSIPSNNPVFDTSFDHCKNIYPEESIRASVENSVGLPHEQFLPTPPASGPSSNPMTPESTQRIQRMSSIEAICNMDDEDDGADDSGREVWHDASEIIL